MSLTAGVANPEPIAILTTTTILNGTRERMYGQSAIPLSAAWPANNQAYLIPFLLAGPVTITRLFFVSGTTPGTTNVDLGIYTEGFSLITSLGAKATVNTTDEMNPSAANGTLTTPVTLPRGRYYVAMSAASTGTTVRSLTATTAQAPRGLGMQTMATAHPLPSTVTPASMGTTAFIPTLGMMATAATAIL